MARVLNVRALRQETLAATLPTTCESGAAGLGAHARAETVLTFPCPFRRLVSAFHSERPLGGEGGYIRDTRCFVNAVASMSRRLRLYVFGVPAATPCRRLSAGVSATTLPA